MSQFIESIKIFNDKFYNIEFHNKRFNETLKEFYDINEDLDLSNLISIPSNLKSNQVYKCRIGYSNKIDTIEFIPYKIRNIKTLRLVEDNEIDYKYKYFNKNDFEKLLINCKADDILIIKNGLVTDTSFSNVIFLNGFKWITPKSYLLNGTKRQQLLKDGIISSKVIRKQDIKQFKYAKLINAMLDIEDSPYVEINNPNTFISI